MVWGVIAPDSVRTTLSVSMCPPCNRVYFYLSLESLLESTALVVEPDRRLFHQRLLVALVEITPNSGR